MAIRHDIQHAETGEQLILQITPDSAISEWKDGERMLVDSDQLSFIYVLETKDDLIYIGLPEPLWGKLSEAMSAGLPVVLQGTEGEDTLPLGALHSELSYLIENIKDNSNYGEEMLEAVEKAFSAHIK
ncbi:hypothetical protein [Fictibacillus fluitans]|uniref:Uncharacterized protein n=1 Tax=Fictibacillus fluitans TaxID=3058422 RepID=A0ABT8HSB3_9BACL|nr:hypothetical protein [Fictibacillus sp. NE201]MDN4523646.1 hypothetical protein [Fictibacillus sp. NE201]